MDLRSEWVSRKKPGHLCLYKFKQGLVIVFVASHITSLFPYDNFLFANN